MSSLRSFADYVTLLSATQRAHHCGLKRAHNSHNDCPGTPSLAPPPPTSPTTWEEFRANMTVEQSWDHCGSPEFHGPHTHKFSMQEGPYTGHCPGTPKFSDPPVAPPPTPPGEVRASRPSWDEYFLTLVDAAAARASCDRGRSGAVFVRDNDVLATGYVGAPPGLPDCFEAGHLMQRVAFADVRVSGTATSEHCVRTIHAEQNGILRAARNGVSLRGATVYCTMEPCQNCAMSLVGLGVVRVVAKNVYHAAYQTREMFTDVGIKLEVLSERQLYSPKLHGGERQPGVRCSDTTVCVAFDATGSAHTEACCYVGEDL